MSHYACLEDSLIISACAYASIHIGVNGLKKMASLFSISLVTAGERHYGVCNASDYMIERFELSIQSCETIVNGLYGVLPNAERAVTEYKEYTDQLIELLYTDIAWSGWWCT